MKSYHTFLSGIVLSIALLMTVFLSNGIADDYCDAVVSYTQGPGVGGPGDAPPNGNDNPDAALGAPEGDSTSGNGLFVSLGMGGELVLAFTDNIVIDEDGDDLTIYELGEGESGTAYISADFGETYVLLGTINSTTSFDLGGTGLSTANQIKIVDSGTNRFYFPYAGIDIDAVEAIHSQEMHDDTCEDPFIQKIKIDGPDQIGICLDQPTAFAFEITYMGPASLIKDTVPAEFEVINVSASHGEAVFFSANDNGQGKKESSATKIEWDVPEEESCNLVRSIIVTVETRQNSGKGHKYTTYEPTKCGTLLLNKGAAAYTVDETGTTISVGPSSPLELEAVCGAKPCTPENLTATYGGVENQDVLLEWDDACTPSDTVIYDIYRSMDNADFKLIAQGVAGSNYLDEEIVYDQAGNDYCYVVVARYESAGSGLKSGESYQACILID